MAGEEGGVATVIRQEGNRVLVSVPMVGFPPGFQLRPGERVVVVTEPTGLAARPLVRSMVVGPQAVAGGGVEIQGERLTLQPASVVAGRDDPGERIIWVVDQGSAEGPKQVIAVRSSYVGRRG